MPVSSYLKNSVIVCALAFVVALTVILGNDSLKNRAISAYLGMSTSKLDIGNFRIQIASDWRVKNGSLHEEGSNHFAILEPMESVPNKGIACPAHLIVSSGETPFFSKIPVGLPIFHGPKGQEMLLVSANDDASGYSRIPKNHGLALYDNQLKIEYFCLSDLSALQQLERKK